MIICIFNLKDEKMTLGTRQSTRQSTRKYLCATLNIFAITLSVTTAHDSAQNFSFVLQTTTNCDKRKHKPRVRPKSIVSVLRESPEDLTPQLVAHVVLNFQSH